MNTVGLHIFVTNLLAVLLASPICYAEEYTVSSPDNKIEFRIAVGKRLEFSVSYRVTQLITPSPIALLLGNGTILGEEPVLTDVQRRGVDNIVYPAIHQKGNRIVESYNELTLLFEGDYSLTLRAYGNGVAYRFETSFPGDIRIRSEEVSFNFDQRDTVYFPREEGFMSHNERLYEKLCLRDITPGSLCSLPVLVQTQSGIHVLVTEADLEDYPGLWLKVSDRNTLSGVSPGVALKEEPSNDRDIKVTQYADFIAETKGSRTFPWRVMAIAENDGDLILNEMVFLLSKPLQLDDVSWIKPGKVAWDWWNALNVYGVDFRASINTDTYKYYIDFASRYGIEYVILDEGWYTFGDLMSTNPDIDMEALTAYARDKNVRIILWVVWKTLEDQLEPALEQFEKWGVSGIKVDFMQRDDQWVVNYYQKIAREAWKRKMLVDFHGSFKPTGLRRSYPNVITREGVRGLEHAKWSDLFVPDHEVMLPFIRMVAGPMDYTPGAMVNAQKDDFRPVFTRPMSIGTRCRQLAMYVVYESPLQMLADNPSNYLREPECMDFLSKVPTVWDETRVLHAQVGRYVAIARRNKDEWYVGAMTDANPRDLNINFSFLDSGAYVMESYIDGINADRYASDYKRVVSTVTQGHEQKITLAPAGGWAARIYKK